ncbi:MAG: iron-containing alcohol dehydrogenase [Ruminococcaceae bacterium]|nr:iron-containing alcohol dehydrogenase [Oscillospiraceae bacterium]
MEMNFVLPTRLVTGRDCVIKNASLLAEYGKKCIIVTGKSSAKKSGALDDMTKALDLVGIEWCVFDGIEQNPSYASCKKASLLAIDFGAQFVVGIGGGSPLDAAKAVAVLATDGKMDEKTMYSSVWERKPLPIVCVGTTAGTGSEVTPVSVITNSSGMKKSFRAITTFPLLSFGDAKYTMSLSRSFTRSTAIDALCHCVESYFNRTANELSRCFAVRGVQILCEMLAKTATDDTLSYEDREKLYCASIYGGLAISVTGTAFPHAFGYFLTENHDLAHGNACGAYLPEFIEYNAANAKELCDSFFASVGVSKKELCALVVENLPEKQVSCGVRLSKEQIDELLPRYENNASLKKCYGTADAALAKKILSKLFLA